MRNLFRPLIGGLKSFLPALSADRAVATASARYCYAVWLRHLAFVSAHGGNVAGAHVVELGPGASLGVALAALLSGARRATALDAVAHAQHGRNRPVYNELVALFRDRAPPPGDDEFPTVQPRVPWLTSLGQLVPDATVDAALAPDRLASIARALRRASGRSPAALLRYQGPWGPDAVAPGSADLVLSQAVLEYLPHDGPDVPRNTLLDRTFATMRRWLRPGGLISHQIDLSSPFGPEWNAHWAVGTAAWALITGRRRHYENRVPRVGYLALCARHGFDVLEARATPGGPGVARERLAPRFAGLPDADYSARGLHLVARKR